MLIKRDEIDKMERRYRANLVNSITGIKPANLIGTRSKQQEDNLAVFSSVVHLGSNPAQIGMITRPQLPKIKDTFSNILETGFYTINHVSQSFIKKAHYTSAKLERQDSEFDLVNLEREFIDNFHAPFVRESKVKLGMKLIENIDLPNGSNFIIGEVVLIQLADALIDEAGRLNLMDYEAVGIAGLDSYYSLNKIASFPYVKLDQIPDFNE